MELILLDNVYSPGNHFYQPLLPCPHHIGRQDLGQVHCTSPGF